MSFEVGDFLYIWLLKLSLRTQMIRLLLLLTNFDNGELLFIWPFYVMFIGLREFIN